MVDRSSHKKKQPPPFPFLSLFPPFSSAHLFTPFLGQGTNQASRHTEGERKRVENRRRIDFVPPTFPHPPLFLQGLEDAVELGRAIGEHGPTPAALRAYEKVRIPAATRVQRGSVAIAKSMAAGGKISEVEWYSENSDVLSHTPAPLV